VLPAQKEPPIGLCGNRTLVGGKTKKEQYGTPCLAPNKEGNRNNKKYTQQICGKNLYNKYVKKKYTTNM